MIKKLLFFIIFVLLGALIYGWWYNYSAITAKQEQVLQSFVNKGPRFTAQDGQELCERVAFLERHSIGFQKSGTIQKPCLYQK